MKTSGNSTRPDALLVSIPEYARLAGISVLLTWRLVSEDTIPSVRLGRTVRIPRKHVEALIAHAGATATECAS